MEIIQKYLISNQSSFNTLIDSLSTYRQSPSYHDGKDFNVDGKAQGRKPSHRLKIYLFHHGNRISHQSYETALSRKHLFRTDLEKLVRLKCFTCAFRRVFLTNLSFLGLDLSSSPYEHKIELPEALL